MPRDRPPAKLHRDADVDVCGRGTHGIDKRNNRKRTKRDSKAKEKINSDGELVLEPPPSQDADIASGGSRRE